MVVALLTFLTAEFKRNNINYMNRVFLVIPLLGAVFFSRAQEKLTLKQAVETAIENNITVRQMSY